MKIIISNADGIPIYSQIYDSIKSAIISGDIASNAPLPSIRSLAKDLKISVITTKRAYDDLERDGFIYTVAGKGSFVAEKNKQMMRESTIKEIEEHLKKAAKLAHCAKLSKDEISEIFDIFYDDSFF